MKPRAAGGAAPDESEESAPSAAAPASAPSPPHAPPLEATEPRTPPAPGDPRTPPAPGDPRRPASSDRYRILELLGAGGMGKVFHAEDLQLRRSVALKFLRGADPSLEQRFFREAQNQARVDHENVCRVYECGHLGGEPYIAMQHIRGRTLREAAAGMTLVEKITVMRAVALGVHAAHKQGLIHRDLKPANILVEKTEDGQWKPYVTDFGLARDLQAPGNTVAGAVLGTPQYMAPEQARGEHDRIDARTDVYGLGAMLYELLAGEPPISGATNLQTLYRLVNEDPPSLDRRVPGLPAELSAVAMKCLEKRRSRRYDSARAFADDLGRYLAGEHVLARPPSALARARRTLRRHRAALIAGGAVLAFFLAQLALRLREPEGTSRMIVAVADFDNQTGEEGLEGLSGLLITSLEQSQRLQVLTRSRMLDLLRDAGRGEVARIDEAKGREIAARAQAGALVLATLRRFDRLYSIDLKILDPRTSEFVFAGKEEGVGRQSVPQLIDRLSEKARRGLREQADEVQKSRSSVADVTTRSMEAYQHYFRGENLFDRLQFSEAIAEFQAAVRIDPSFALAWYQLGYANLWTHDAPRARDALDHALRLIDRVPEKEKLLITGARASISGEGQKAYASYKACTDRFPQEKECAFLVGDLMFHGGYVEPATGFFLRALELDGGMERALTHLVSSWQLLGRKEQLVQTAQQYAARVGNDDAWCTLGRAQAAAGDPVKARATLLHAAQLFPASALPIAELAALDAHEGKLDDARERLLPLLAPARSPRDRWLGLHTLAGVSLLGGRVRGAIDAYEAAERAAGEAKAGELRAASIASKGMVLVLYNNDQEGARKLEREARALGIPEAYLGYLYPFTGDFADYGRLLRDLGDPMVDEEVRSFEARAAGRAADAVKGFAGLVQRSTFRGFFLYLLASAQADLGDDAAAVDSLRKAQAEYYPVNETGPGFSTVFRARAEHVLAALEEHRGDRAGALAHTERFLELWKDADPEQGELREARTRRDRLRGGPPAAPSR